MFTVHKLENGLHVVLEPNPFVRSISFGIWVANGSRHEEKNENGISHFIEHMLFKGTENRSAKAIADEMDAIGGQINAYTSKEYTCYHTRTLDTHFDIALDVMSDMFFHSSFLDTEIVKEKNVILEEINMYEDSPEDLCYDLLQENIFSDHPLGRPILGKEETIGAFSHGVLKEYVGRRYCPYNTVVSAAGNFTEDEMLAKLQQAFGSWQICASPKKIVPPVYSPCINAKEKDIEQVHVYLSFPGLPMGHDDSYALSIFNTVFGGGMSSRLFQKIREDHGLTYSIYSYLSSYKDIGLFSIYAGMGPSQTKEVLNLIFQEVQEITRENIDQDTLHKTKEQIKSNYIIGMESTSSRMASIGRSQLCLGKIQTPEEILQKVDNVTLEDIQRVAGNIFLPGQQALYAVGKTKGLNFEEMVNFE